MSCIAFLRRHGLWPRRHFTERELAAAIAEQASRDNEAAFAQMRQAYEKVPDSNERLRRSIRQSPFAALETSMRGGGRRT